MQIDLSAQESEFQTVLRRFLAERVSPDYIRQRIESGAFDPALWESLVDLGIFEVFADSENELSANECMLLVQEFARHLVPEAASEQLVGGAFLFSLLNAEGKAALEKAVPFEEIINGSKIVGMPFGQSNGTMSGGKFTGTLHYVPRCSTTLDFVLHVDKDTVSLIAVSSDFSSIEECASVDLSRRYCHITLNGAPVVVLPGIDAERYRCLQQLLVSHETVGLCKRIERLTTEYVKTRKQFGEAIGSFQAVQHTLADMHAWLEAMDALALFAAWAFDSSASQRVFACETAARLSLTKGITFMERAIQMHGGIGFTWEYDLHLYLRRILFHKGLYDPEGQSDSRLLDAVLKV